MGSKSETLVEIQAGWLRGSDHRRMAWISALTSDMVFTQPVLYEFPDLGMPVLLIIGQRDRTAIGKAWAPPEVKPTLGNYPELGRRAQAAIPKARLVAIEEARHLPQVEAFERYWRGLEEFLGGGSRDIPCTVRPSQMVRRLISLANRQIESACRTTPVGFSPLEGHAACQSAEPRH